MPDIAYVGQGVGSSSPTTNTVITLPTGSMQVNDFIVIAAAVGDTADNGLAAPTEGGYTDVLEVSDLYSNDVNDVNLDLYYRYWDGVQTTATFANAGGSNASNVATCYVFRNVALVAEGGPFRAAPVTATGINSSNADPPSIATGTGDAVVIIGATGHTGGATATYTNPANYTTNPAVRAHNDTIDCLMGMGYRLSGYANPENPAVFTAATIGTAADNAWAAISLALKRRPFTAAVTGTITNSALEADIVAGGKTAILTLTNDEWIAAGAGSFDLQRDEIIAAFDSAQSEATGWDLVPKATQSLGGVVRTSNTVVTITWDAFPTYNITAQETITVTVPASAILGTAENTVATPTFTVSTPSSGTPDYYNRMMR